MTKLMTLLVAGTAIAGFTSTQASAVTISYTSTPVSNMTTNYSTTTSVQKFDTNLGTLVSISFTLAGTVVSTIAFESRDAAASTITGTSSASITLTRPDGTQLVNVLPTQSRTQSETAFDGVVDFAGTSGDTFSNLTGSTTATSATLTSASDLALFSQAGGGSILLPISAAGTSSVAGAGNIVSQISTSAGSDVTVTYNYNAVPTTSVPEPATLALLGAGLVGAGALRRRRSI